MLYDSITFHSPSISKAYLHNVKSSAKSIGLVYYLHSFSKQDLSTGGDSFALEASSEVFKRFGWDAPPDVLKSYQKLYRS